MSDWDILSGDESCDGGMGIEIAASAFGLLAMTEKPGSPIEPGMTVGGKFLLIFL